jgi:pimeloyl-ACP methyl ester carboxylesterase
MLPYDEAGRGPAVVLLHAGICDRSMWSEHLESLAAAGHRALAVDIPGFGEAEAQAGEQAPWTDVLATLDELSIQGAAVVGNSFGGAVALRIAAVAPERVTALVAISAPAPGIEPSPQLEAAWEAEEAALERGDIDGALKVVLDTWTQPDAPPALREQVAEMQRRTYELQGAIAEVVEAPDPVEEDPSVLNRMEMPALVMVGDRDLSDFRQGAEQLAEALPRARLEVIEGAGHLAPLETPDEFRRLLLEFLGGAPT